MEPTKNLNRVNFFKKNIFGLDQRKLFKKKLLKF